MCNAKSMKRMNEMNPTDKELMIVFDFLHKNRSRFSFKDSGTEFINYENCVEIISSKFGYPKKTSEIIFHLWFDDLDAELNTEESFDF
jgi:hypothetical protein